VAECVEFFTTGTISRATGGGSGSKASSAWVVNPTLLQPGSRAWRLHYGALPFLGYLPLDHVRHSGLATARGPRALTAACLSELATLLRGWQACRTARTVQARLWCCDALALCARWAGEAGEAPSSVGGDAAKTAEPRRFDAIDTSNLADHLGTLNVLALAAPLLRPAAHARWVRWGSGCGRAVRMRVC
jgi:hypothetical protein